MAQLFETEKKPMTDADRLRIGAEHAKHALDLVALKEEKKDAARVYRVKIRELEERIAALATQLDEGAFDVRFEVEEIPDDARKLVEVRRKDTGERVGVRQMTEVEKAAADKRRQGELFDGDDDEERSDTEPPPPVNNVRRLGARKPGRKPKGGR